jgi:hypothetical protein
MSLRDRWTRAKLAYKTKPEEAPEPVKCEPDQFEVRPCPCCGSNWLHVGDLGSLLRGIKCRACGLKLTRPIDLSERPEGIETIDQLRAWQLIDAINGWNRRA